MGEDPRTPPETGDTDPTQETGGGDRGSGGVGVTGGSARGTGKRDRVRDRFRDPRECRLESRGGQGADRGAHPRDRTHKVFPPCARPPRRRVQDPRPPVHASRQVVTHREAFPAGVVPRHRLREDPSCHPVRPVGTVGTPDGATTLSWVPSGPALRERDSPKEHGSGWGRWVTPVRLETNREPLTGHWPLGDEAYTDGHLIRGFFPRLGVGSSASVPPLHLRGGETRRAVQVPSGHDSQEAGVRVPTADAPGRVSPRVRQ